MGLNNADVNIIYVNDRQIRKLNAQYLKRDRPTDVIAFPMNEINPEQIESFLLGDIAVSVETASRQAEELGHTLQRELNILTIHGLLHLAGYDDSTEEELKKMNKKTEELLMEMSLAK